MTYIWKISFLVGLFVISTLIFFSNYGIIINKSLFFHVKDSSQLEGIQCLKIIFLKPEIMDK